MMQSIRKPSMISLHLVRANHAIPKQSHFFARTISMTSMTSMNPLAQSEQVNKKRSVATNADDLPFQLKLSRTIRSDGLLAPNIFAHFSQLALQYNAVNLGQGCPSENPAQFIVDAAAESLHAGHHQYHRPGGHPILINAVAKHYSASFGRDIDPLTEVTAFNGAQHGIALSIASLCNPGDEIVVIEPYFDAYRKAANLVGATIRGVPMRIPAGIHSAHDCSIDPDALERAITPRTKLLLLNSPHNPTGKVFTLSELQEIADVVRKFPNLAVLSDEVYESSVFDGHTHHRFCRLDGMESRTLTLFSAGKSFSVTGWRIGYMIGPSPLIAPLLRAVQSTTFCCPAPLEVAVGLAIPRAADEGYFQEQCQSLQDRRDLLVDGLTDVGLTPVTPHGGWFCIADTSSLPLPAHHEAISTSGTTPDPVLSRDIQAATWLTQEVGVATIPLSPFYTEENKHLADKFLRFSFCKSEGDIERAIVLLKRALK
eukprot:m.352769 g.352769  ORF g.352769 m.352769 type:complete len:484 (-) comp20711_c0_seq4:142-1593(-)